MNVSASPSGAPIAKTWSPDRRREPNRIGVTDDFGSTLRTARSVSLSRPTIVAGSCSPLGRCTVIVPPPTPGEMTWLLVRMCPSLSRNSPEPFPDDAPALTRIVTTDGMVDRATSRGLHSALSLARDQPIPATSATTDTRTSAATRGNQVERSTLLIFEP